MQELLNMNKNKNYRRPQKNTALLTGIIKCKECGSIMRPRILTNRFDEAGKPKYIYCCTLKEKSRGNKCKGKNINGNKLDKLLLEEIKNIDIPKEKIHNELSKIDIVNIDILNKTDEYIALKSKYNKNQKSLKNLIQKMKYIDIEIIEEVNKEIKKIKMENKEIEKKLKKLEIENVKKIELNITKISNQIIEKNFETFEILDITEKKKLLRLIIESAIRKWRNSANKFCKT